MNKRFLQVGIVLVVLLVIVIISNNQTPIYNEQHVEKIDDIVVTPTPFEKTQEDIEQEQMLKNYKILTSKMNLIEEKYEALKKIIPSDYEKISELELQINTLKTSIEDNKQDIATENDISQNITENLNTVNDALTLLIETFSDEASNIIIGTIESVGSELVINVNDEKYIVETNGLTVYDGSYQVGSFVIIVCENPINIEEKNMAKLFIVK